MTREVQYPPEQLVLERGTRFLLVCVGSGGSQGQHLYLAALVEGLELTVLAQVRSWRLAGDSGVFERERRDASTQTE